MTGRGGEGRNKFCGAREVYLCEFERGTGAREIYPGLDQMNNVKTKDSKGFFGEIGNSSGFSGRKQVISKKRKKKGIHPKNVMKSGVSPQKLRIYRWQTPMWASICTPVASSLLISSGHSPRLEGHNFCLGGHGPDMPPRGAGSAGGRPRTRWTNYIEDLGWNRLGLHPSEMMDVMEEREVWRLNLELLPPQPSLKSGQ